MGSEREFQADPKNLVIMPLSDGENWLLGLKQFLNHLISQPVGWQLERLRQLMAPGLYREAGA